jgi:hypothetical protein
MVYSTFAGTFQVYNVYDLQLAKGRVASSRCRQLVTLFEMCAIHSVPSISQTRRTLCSRMEEH